jgi:hypothetical protein
MNRQIDEQSDGWKEIWMERDMDGQTMDGQAVDGQSDGWTVRWMDSQMDGQPDGWTDSGWTVRWMDGWMDGQMDGWIVRETDRQGEVWKDRGINRQIDKQTDG